MKRRAFVLPLALSMVIASCSVGEAEDSTTTAAPTTTTTSSTTSTSVPPTTTTTTPVTVDDAPQHLVDAIEAFYDFAAGRTDTAPEMPEPVLAAITPGDTATPKSGVASVGVFDQAQLAVVEMGEDLFLAVADGGGWRIVGGEWPSLSLPAYFGEGPRHVAVVGSDARPGQPMDRTRADSIHFVALDGAGSGAVVGVPRDSYVPVPGYGRKKITASLALGGPETMMAAFNDLTGLPLEGYVLTGFSGFETLMDSVLGGVTVDIPFAINDRWAKVALNAGEQLLNGAQALGFARARKTVPRGDFTRSEHQGVILLAAARTVGSMGYLAIPRLIELSEGHLMTNLDVEQLLTFSALTISTDLDTVSNMVAPGSVGTAGGASVVFLAGSVAELWVDLADGRLGG
ncbi:MAG TPA: LCP family protein [Acidimicrobiia bacterium]|nr:LCP family protein [Acidimicrobiia bacterium]